MLTRRNFLQTLAMVGLSATSASLLARPLSFLIEKNDAMPLSANQKHKLARAILDFLEHHYKGMTLQFWSVPFEKIDFEKRITNIIYWVDLAIQEQKSLYPVDAVWVMSQIMAESLFCELAISPSLAAGICQFMPSTATNSYQMTVAGSLEQHKAPPYVVTELADSLTQYRILVQERNQYRRDTRHLARFTLEESLQLLAEGKAVQKEAQAQLERDAHLKAMFKRIEVARDNYITYIETNSRELGNDDIFGKAEFYMNFDERLTYKKPIFAMVHMLANALRVRNGNILTAAAAYNAGLKRTWTNEIIYTNYGMLPGIEETARYLSRIVANYEEIGRRYFA